MDEQHNIMDIITIVSQEKYLKAESMTIHAKYRQMLGDGYSPAARGGNLAKIPTNQVIDDFGGGSSVESESE